jgi:hypothetical protein
MPEKSGNLSGTATYPAEQVIYFVLTHQIQQIQQLSLAPDASVGNPSCLLNAIHFTMGGRLLPNEAERRCKVIYKGQQP